MTVGPHTCSLQNADATLLINLGQRFLPCLSHKSAVMIVIMQP